MRAMQADHSHMLDFDYIVVGSGFGGSVSALRLAEKGYRVAVIERGKRWKTADFPRTNWNLRKYLWAPLVRCFGIQAITLLRDVMILHGCGVGGGSLVYANTLLIPPDRVFEDPRWRALGSIDWHHGRWLASYAAEYIGSYTEPVEPANLIGFAPYRRSVDAVLYHDLEAGFELDSGVALRAAVTNVLDEDPPYVNGGSIANTDTETYRLLGRSYFVEMRYRVQ